MLKIQTMSNHHFEIVLIWHKMIFDIFMKMQGQKWNCKADIENARTTKKAVPWIASRKSSDQKPPNYISIITYFVLKLSNFIHFNAKHIDTSFFFFSNFSCVIDVVHREIRDTVYEFDGNYFTVKVHHFLQIS